MKRHWFKRNLLFIPLSFAVFIIGIALLHSRAAPAGIGTVPQIVSFTALPAVAEPGQAVTLAWNARGTDSVELNWAAGGQSDAAEPERANLPAIGRITVHPNQDTVYKLTCETADGPMCSTSVTVRTALR
jgi:hypothetical protein